MSHLSHLRHDLDGANVKLQTDEAGNLTALDLLIM